MEIKFSGFGYVKKFEELDGKIFQIDVVGKKSSSFEQYEPSTIVVKFTEFFDKESSI
jgi:hypothetical protein